MQTPEQSYFMTKIVIDEMSQFPNNIPVDKPIPRKACFDDPIFFKKSYAKSNGCNREKTREKPVEYKDQKRNFVFFNFEPFVDNCSYNFDQQQQRHDRRDHRQYPVES